MIGCKGAAATCAHNSTFYRHVDDEQNLVAFSLSGNATFAAKHLMDGRTDGFSKGHWLSQKVVTELFPEKPPTWIVALSWWHFQGLTISGGERELEEHFTKMKQHAMDIKLDGDTPISIEIKEEETLLEDDDLATLAKIWPGQKD